MSGLPAETLPECTAIVVSYNSVAELPECLQALIGQTGVALQIEVVDNASKDGSAALVRDRFPTVRLTEAGANLGFGRANNLALERVETAYVALVNPDAILSPSTIATCLRVLRAEPDAAAVSTRLVHGDGTLQPSCHSFLNLTNLFGETFLLDRLFPRWRALSSLHLRDFAHDERRDVDWIQGAFLVVRHAAVRSVGVFDPDFFMYGEEMDWCYRARRAGWRVVFLPEPPVVHHGGASSRPIAGPMFVEVLKSRIRFLGKHRGPLVVLTARVLTAISVLLRAAVRQLQASLAVIVGRPVSEELTLRVRMFGAAVRWLLRGLPLTPFVSNQE